ncbi:MAG: sugar transferase [Candidatus Omnitrophica bacterium]|nr:sugar transferase [Candidatus Omnitrophota bacterium]
MRDFFAKRAFDLLFSAVFLIISLPIWLIISILILIEDNSPIYYAQERVGKKGRIFKLIKFRSMIPNAEQHTGPIQARENDPRITGVGRFLRKTAMDELPQLINILKGDMSFVGPRALRPYEIENKTGNCTDLVNHPRMVTRHLIKPGLTGAAQVFAPYDMPLSKKLKYDRWYIKNRGLILDLWLIAVSFLITFSSRWEARDRKLKVLRLGYVDKKV